MAAFRSTQGLWKAVLNSIRSNNAKTYATSTMSKMKSYTPAANQWAYSSSSHKEASSKRALWWPPRGDYFPVYVALGFIVMSTTMGVHTLMHHIRNNPSVRVKKKLRYTRPEVVDPDKVVDESLRFLCNSWFRKLAHVQEFNSRIQNLPYPETTDVYALSGRAESLKSVGLDPGRT
ncbi:hypothetical protein LINPERPRIM_LOCUS30599 [Linum perenne]